eukprot:5564205-Prymnesium_polylepis.1
MTRRRRRTTRRTRRPNSAIRWVRNARRAQVWLKVKLRAQGSGSGLVPVARGTSSGMLGGLSAVELRISCASSSAIVRRSSIAGPST